MKKFKVAKLFQEEDTKFLLGCAFKFSTVYLLMALLIYYIIWVILSVNSIYFETLDFGISQDLRAAFLDSSMKIIFDRILYFLGFYILLFLAGLYLGKLLLRPFDIIAKYSEGRTNDQKIEFNPDTFSDYKFLTRFGEFFFRYLAESEKTKKLAPNTVPPSFAKIRTPPFERVFFFHFILFIIILAIITGYFMGYFVAGIRDQLLEHSINTFSSSKKISTQFFSNQFYIFDSIILMSILGIFVSYISLSLHLYSKVSGGIFAFFLTMRSFMKGNHSARVHFVGFPHLRSYGRLFNKYLDKVERECEKSDNDVKS